MAIAVICAVAALVVAGLALRLRHRPAGFGSVPADLIGWRYRCSTRGMFRVSRHLFIWSRRSSRR